MKISFLAKSELKILILIIILISSIYIVSNVADGSPDVTGVSAVWSTNIGVTVICDEQIRSIAVAQPDTIRESERGDGGFRIC